MSEKNLDEKVDKLEAAVDPNTVISIGGYNFTPAKLMIAGTIVTTILGGLYGAFEVYKDYMDMKEKIQMYVAPDLAEVYKKLELLEANTNKAVDYTNEIKNDLKQDLRRTEGVVENVERSNKELQREVRTELRSLQKEVDSELRGIKQDVDKKIKQALDNPLANQ